MKSLRVASHVHTSWSYDGEWALEDVARTFGRLGYDAVLTAEHCRTFDQRRWEEYKTACSVVSGTDMLLVPGIEYEDGDNCVHTVVWGSSVPFLGSARPTLEILQAASEHAAATLMAHPNRRDAISRFLTDWAPLLTGVEIWNRKYDGVAPNCDAQASRNRSKRCACWRRARERSGAAPTSTTSCPSWASISITRANSFRWRCQYRRGPPRRRRRSCTRFAAAHVGPSCLAFPPRASHVAPRGQPCVRSKTFAAP